MRKKVSRVGSFRWRGGSVSKVWDTGEGVVMEKMGGEWEACGTATSQILGPPGQLEPLPLAISAHTLGISRYLCVS